MRTYKVLFADDRAEQFEAFQDTTVRKLAASGISFDPLHYSPSYEPAKPPTGESVRERLTVADEEGPYDIVISDLNFHEFAGGGVTDGINVLKDARARSATTRMILITAYKRDVDPKTAIELSRSTGLSEAEWINLMGGSFDWLNVAAVCQALCDAVDAERLAISARAVPDPFEVVVLEDVPDRDQGLLPRLRVEIVEKKKSLLVTS